MIIKSAENKFFVLLLDLFFDIFTCFCFRYYFNALFLNVIIILRNFFFQGIIFNFRRVYLRLLCFFFTDFFFNKFSNITRNFIF